MAKEPLANQSQNLLVEKLKSFGMAVRRRWATFKANFTVLNKFPDWIYLTIALVTLIAVLILVFRPLESGRDPQSRINIIFLGFVFVSGFISVCKHVSPRGWGLAIMIGGSALWFISVWFGSPGRWKSICDSLYINC